MIFMLSLHNFWMPNIEHYDISFLNNNSVCTIPNLLIYTQIYTLQIMAINTGQSHNLKIRGGCSTDLFVRN